MDDPLRWLISTERVHYVESEIPELVDKPLDPQAAKLSHAEDHPPQTLRVLDSTQDLPKVGKPNEGYQIRGDYWYWVGNEWKTMNGTYGH